MIVPRTVKLIVTVSFNSLSVVANAMSVRVVWQFLQDGTKQVQSLQAQLVELDKVSAAYVIS